MEGFQTKMTDKENQIKHLISSVLPQEVERKLNQYEKVRESFAKFFNTDELTKILSKKADISQVEEVSKRMVSMVEIDKQNKTSDNIYQRLLQVSLLLVEVSSALVPTKTSTSTHNAETTQARISKREYLLRQSKIIAKWVESLKTSDQGQISLMQTSVMPKDVDRLDSFMPEDDKMNQSHFTNYNFRSLSQTNSPERSTLLNNKMLNIQPLTTQNNTKDVNVGSQTESTMTVRRGFVGKSRHSTRKVKNLMNSVSVSFYIYYQGLNLKNYHRRDSTQSSLNYAVELLHNSIRKDDTYRLDESILMSRSVAVDTTFDDSFMSAHRNQNTIRQGTDQEFPPIRHIVPRLERVTIHNKLDASKKIQL